MKKFAWILVLSMLITLIVPCTFIPVSAAYTVGQTFSLDGFGEKPVCGQFSFYKRTGTAISLSDLTPLDVVEFASAGLPLAGQQYKPKEDDNKRHFLYSNGQKIAFCEYGVMNFIVFTAPIDGEYTYHVAAHTWWSSFDTEIGINCNGVWHQGYVPQKDVTAPENTDSVTLKKGDKIYFLFRLTMGDNFDPVTIDTFYVTLDKITGEQPPEYTVNITGGSLDRENGKYMEGETVTITAILPSEDVYFEKWIIEGVEVEDDTANPLSFTMPNGNVTVTASYKEIVRYDLTIENGTMPGGKTSGRFEPGANITISANKAPDGKVFDHWEVTGIELDDLTTRQISFNMPESDVTVKAVYADVGGDPSPSGNNTDKAPANTDKGNGGEKSDKPVNTVLVVILVAAISVVVTALVMYLIFDQKNKKAPKNDTAGNEPPTNQ